VEELVEGKGDPKTMKLTESDPLGPVTGRSIDRRTGYNPADLSQSVVTEKHGVVVYLKYADGMNPPFVVVTSYPA
jgi:hypothetical protein